jgi:hypothetical protein
MDEHSPALSPVPASITRSQAQVLRYLPEQVPFSIIADKLGISRSAAKERAEARTSGSACTTGTRRSAALAHAGCSAGKRPQQTNRNYARGRSLVATLCDHGPSSGIEHARLMADAVDALGGVGRPSTRS